MSHRHLPKLVAAVALATIVSGCAGTVARPTPESARVTSGTYDGIWQVNVMKSAGTQYVGKWNLSCDDMRTTFNINVIDGAIVLEDENKSKKTYVSDKGRFKMYFPIAHKASASQQSSTTMANGNMKIILRGRLDRAKSVGYLTYGIAELGYGGCTAKTRFKYLGESRKDQSA